MEAFLPWMRRCGFELHPSVGFCTFGGVQGAAALNGPIAAGETLFRVPVAALLGPLSPHSVAGRRGVCRGVKDRWARCILCLMAENCAGPASFWAPFLATLPHPASSADDSSSSSALHAPLLWPQSQASELLQGTETLARLGREEIEEQWRVHVAPVVARFPDVFPGASFADYVHWGSVALSRAFEAHPNYRGPVMVPMADALNHRTGLCNAHLHLQSEDADALPMVALSDVAKGAELINTYGDLGNGELLRRYGFTDEENPFDEVCVPVSFLLNALPEAADSSAFLRRTKQRLSKLVAHGAVPEDVFTLTSSRSRSSAIPIEMRRAAHALCLSPGEFRISKARGLHRIVAPATARLSGEERKMLEAALERRLAQYPTTLSEDEEALLSVGLPINVLNALRVRVGEKRLLHMALSGLKKHL